MTNLRKRASAWTVIVALAVTVGSLPPVASAAPVGATVRAGDSRPPASRRIAKPKKSSLEYRLSWGLASIRADRAYASGVDGTGIMVAMIDAGGAVESVGLFTDISPASTDLVQSRTMREGDESHARQTATLLAARLDGEGTLGAAYGARLLSVRIDADGSCRTDCFAHGADLARGIDYAVAQGARIIGVPLVGQNRLPSVEPALRRAAEAGAVIIMAAGNDGAGEVSWPARYAADSRLRDAMLVVGASTIAGEAAIWSNRAGTVADRYLVAPGENLLVDCGKESCRLVSGTSFSVPFVAGALSLVMARRPGLTAQQAARILLSSASDLGARGRDGDTGAGLLNVAEAMRVARSQRAERAVPPDGAI